MRNAGRRAGFDPLLVAVLDRFSQKRRFVIDESHTFVGW